MLLLPGGRIEALTEGTGWIRAFFTVDCLLVKSVKFQQRNMVLMLSRLGMGIAAQKSLALVGNAIGRAVFHGLSLHSTGSFHHLQCLVALSVGLNSGGFAGLLQQSTPRATSQVLTLT
jgi:hypothetical protein